MAECNHSFHEMQFLVVDDSQSMRRIIARTLRKMGCEVVFEAHNGRSAWEHIQNERIDFIVCDWNMPGMKGIELLREIRKSDKYKDLPFLMVSAEVNTERIFEAIQCGVSNYLPKPFTPDILRKKIEVILDAKKGLC